MMLRVVGTTIILALIFGASAQDKATLEKQRMRTLDTAAKTPFFTQKGADAVKRVVSGARDRKEDEKATDPLDHPQGAAPSPNSGSVKTALDAKGTPGATEPSQKTAPPPQEHPFGWHLMGISYGRRSGVALFQLDSKSVSASAGALLDPDTKVLSVTRTGVLLEFHGKRLQLMPW